jgi:hypothetical protein
VRPLRNRSEIQAVPARFTSSTRLRPSAAARFGVNPRSPIRATIAPSTSSRTSQLTRYGTDILRLVGAE